MKGEIGQGVQQWPFRRLYIPAEIIQKYWEEDGQLIIEFKEMEG